MSNAGHNSGVAADQLKSIIERVERLHEERRAIGSDISDVYKEAKGSGFDVGALKAIVKLRSEDPAKREERETIIDLYRSAIGMA